MKRSAIPLLLAGSLALGGCAASIAAGVVGAAVRAASPAPQQVGYSADLITSARDACRVRATQHGAVHIIDAEQGRGGRVRVWGTVQDSRERRSFVCTYNGQVAGFTLRAIPRSEARSN